MSQVNFQIELGTKVRCKITGFEGIVNGQSKWLNGCIQYSVRPKIDKDGKLIDSWYFDEAQLELVDDKPIATEMRSTGGPETRSPQ